MQKLSEDLRKHVTEIINCEKNIIPLTEKQGKRLKRKMLSLMMQQRIQGHVQGR